MPTPSEWTARGIRKLLDDGRLDDGRLPAAFVLELLQWLRDQPSTAAPAWQALQEALQEQGDSADEMLRLEHQIQAADQLAISNVITSMRRASAIDWTLFFERVSVVEQVLRGDPCGRICRDGLLHSRSLPAFRSSNWRVAHASLRRRSPSAPSSSPETQSETEPHQDRRHHVGTT